MVSPSKKRACATVTLLRVARCVLIVIEDQVPFRTTLDQLLDDDHHDDDQEIYDFASEDLFYLSF